VATAFVKERVSQDTIVIMYLCVVLLNIIEQVCVLYIIRVCNDFSMSHLRKQHTYHRKMILSH
jgi:hypothetical protein